MYFNDSRDVKNHRIVDALVILLTKNVWYSISFKENGQFLPVLLRFSSP